MFENTTRIRKSLLFFTHLENNMSNLYLPTCLKIKAGKVDGKWVVWDDVRIRNWAGAIGKYTVEVVGRIFEGMCIKEQGYNPALAVLRLSNKYSKVLLEAAYEFAITNGIKKPRYHHLSSILASNQDEIYMEQKKASAKTAAPMGYLRGSDYYGGGRDDQ